MSNYFKHTRKDEMELDPDMLLPSELGIHGFDKFRVEQWEAVQYVTQSSKRFSALCLPTGAGKSLTVIAIAKLMGWKLVALTSTKGLQTQYMKDFQQDGMVDVRGKANYQCVQFPYRKCDEGARHGCVCAGSGKCPYTAAVGAAKRSSLVTTNYAYWLNANSSGRGLELPNVDSSKVDCLVLDEAHCAAEELSRYLQINIYQSEIEEILGEDCIPKRDEIEDWVMLGRTFARQITEEATEMGKHLTVQGSNADPEAVEYQRRLEVFGEKLTKLAGMVKGEWVIESKEGRRGKGGKIGSGYWVADPIWPGRYAEKNLFVGVPKIILISATLNRKTLSLLGIKGHECNYREWPRIFPANRNPVYHVPTVRMNFRTTEEGLLKWVERIDQVISGRLDRKGIIHTVSYARQKYLMEHSKHRGLMMGNTSDPESQSATEIVKAFKASKAPRILVSPSFSTGWDFPGEECEYQIISKIAFPEGSSKVMKARKAKDGQYLNHIAMQDLVQATGRPSRSMQDRSETVIVDDNIGWFLAQNRELAPSWFQVRKMAVVPTAPKKLLKSELAAGSGKEAEL